MTHPDSSPEERSIITAWAEEVSGPIVELSVSGAHWSPLLEARGLSVVVKHPNELIDDNSTYGGILAWYCLIHRNPADIPKMMTVLRDRLAQGGSVLLGFFAGPQLARVPHSNGESWMYPHERITALAQRAGLRAEEFTAFGAHPSGTLSSVRAYVD